VGILIEFFNVDPNASSDIDDELHTSVFGMAALSRKWRLCIVLFDYITRVTPQNINVQHCMLLQWFVGAFRWNMVFSKVNRGYVCVLGNVHPQCLNIYSEILQSAISAHQ